MFRDSVPPIPEILKRFLATVPPGGLIIHFKKNLNASTVNLLMLITSTQMGERSKRLGGKAVGTKTLACDYRLSSAALFTHL